MLRWKRMDLRMYGGREQTRELTSDACGLKPSTGWSRQKKVLTSIFAPAPTPHVPLEAGGNCLLSLTPAPCSFLSANLPVASPPSAFRCCLSLSNRLLVASTTPTATA